MTRKGHPMDHYFQIYNLKSHLRSNSITPDLLDIHAILDRKLRLPENINNIDRIFNIGSRNESKYYQENNNKEVRRV